MPLLAPVAPLMLLVKTADDAVNVLAVPTDVAVLVTATEEVLLATLLLADWKHALDEHGRVVLYQRTSPDAVVVETDTEGAGYTELTELTKSVEMVPG